MLYKDAPLKTFAHLDRSNETVSSLRDFLVFAIHGCFKKESLNVLKYELKTALEIIM